MCQAEFFGDLNKHLQQSKVAADNDWVWFLPASPGNLADMEQRVAKNSCKSILYNFKDQKNMTHEF